MAKIKTNQKNKQERDFNRVQVISRAVSILRAVRDADGLSLNKLVEEVGLARSTVYRILSTLEHEGFLIMGGPGEEIQLGTELVSLGAAVHRDMRSELRPYLEELSYEVDETIDLSILETDYLISLDQIARLRPLRAVSLVGSSSPLHCSANGKALLSTLLDEEVKRILPEKLKRFTEKTIVDRAKLLKELNVIRTSGIAYDHEEHNLGICAVSVIVRGPWRNNTAAISILVPSVRFYKKEKEIISVLQRTKDTVNSKFNPSTYSYW